MDHFASLSIISGAKVSPFRYLSTGRSKNKSFLKRIEKYIAIIFAVFIVIVGSKSEISAAEFTFDRFYPTPAVLMEGTIEAGDSEKLQKLIDGRYVFSIYLASPGGDVVEAMKIGRVMRELNLTAIVPTKIPADMAEELTQRHGIRSRDNNVCLSACFFVLAGGIYREGFATDDVILGVHKPYLSNSDLLTMNADQSMTSEINIHQIIHSYLNEMGISAKYEYLMFSAQKDELIWINSREFSNDLAGFVPELVDWVDARCGHLSKVEKSLWNDNENKSGSEIKIEIWAIMKPIMEKQLKQGSCEQNLRDQLVVDVATKRMTNNKGAATTH